MYSFCKMMLKKDRLKWLDKVLEMNLFKLEIIFLLMLSNVSGAKADVSDYSKKTKSYFDQDRKHVICKEPIPIFTLKNYNSNPSDKEVATLCSCIWNKFPEGRWERDEMRRMFNGGDPTWRTRGMIHRFGKAIKVCGGYEL